MASENEKVSMPTVNRQDSEITVTEIKRIPTDADIELAPIEAEEPVFAGESVHGWVIVFAAFFSHMIFMGFGNVYGVYQNYYLNNTFQGRATSFQLAWIGSLTMMALDISGPFTGAICVHFGFRKSGFAGVVIMTMSLVAAAYATEIWQLYLTQGILYGFGGSLTYFSSLSLPSQWFRRNRGLATGITISGGGIGGLWLSPLISKLLESKGLRWTMLCCAIAHFVLLTPLVLLFKSLVETGRERAKRIAQFGYRKGESRDGEKKRKFIDFTVLKEVRFCLLFIAGIFVVGGYFVPFYYINSYAIQHGVDASSAALMVGLMNGSSAFGRIIMGMVSDLIGPINALVISTLAASLSLLLIWTFAKTAAVMFVFSVVYGFCCGAYLSSTVSVTGAICGLERLAVVTGIIYAGMAIGSGVGAPIAGAILDTVGHGTDYIGVIIFTGAILSIGTAILFVLRFKTSRKIFVHI
ncbi:hypothetical protein BGZ93_007206 [Podila epicladia]|nr:hypothetical protein BGZ93_007206 [Podila epicladia]